MVERDFDEVRSNLERSRFRVPHEITPADVMAEIRAHSRRIDAEEEARGKSPATQTPPPPTPKQPR